MRRKNCMRAIAAAGVGLAAAACQARADVIYQDNFDGTAGTVSGRAVPTASGLDGGTAGASWNSSATTATNPDALWQASGGTYTTTGSTNASVGTFTTGADTNLITNATLPFTPQAGFVYDLHLAIASSGVGASGNWLGLAFTQAGFNGHAIGGGSSALSNDNSYGLMILKGSGVVQTFAGLNAGNAVTTTATVTDGTTSPVYTPVDVLLDTSGAQWTVNWEVNGTSTGAGFTYTTNPTIGLLAFGTNKLTGAVSDFSLTATSVPEPASLGVLGVAGLLALRRRRTA